MTFSAKNETLDCPGKNHFKPYFKASNENTFNNHHRIIQGDVFLVAFEISALRLDMVFLQIPTNTPKQFSRLYASGFLD